MKTAETYPFMEIFDLFMNYFRLINFRISTQNANDKQEFKVHDSFHSLKVVF